MNVSIVVPVFRSAGCLPELVARVGAMGAQLGRFELILVNDASPDNSWEVIRELAASHPFVVGLDLRRNVGQDNALMAGLRRARGAVVVIWRPRMTPSIRPCMDRGSSSHLT